MVCPNVVLIRRRITACDLPPMSPYCQRDYQTFCRVQYCVLAFICGVMPHVIITLFFVKTVLILSFNCYSMVNGEMEAAYGEKSGDNVSAACDEKRLQSQGERWGVSEKAKKEGGVSNNIYRWLSVLSSGQQCDVTNEEGEWQQRNASPVCAWRRQWRNRRQAAKSAAYVRIFNILEKTAARSASSARSETSKKKKKQRMWRRVAITAAAHSIYARVSSGVRRK